MFHAKLSVIKSYGYIPGLIITIIVVVLIICACIGCFICYKKRKSGTVLSFTDTLIDQKMT